MARTRRGRVVSTAWGRCLSSPLCRARRGGDLSKVPGPRRRGPGPGERLEPPERSVSKPARRNSFCFAASRGRRRLGPGPRVCMGSVASFQGRRAPDFTFQELNEKFFGAGRGQARTPCAGGACRQPSACACPAPPPATRRGPATTRVRYCARAGGHCGSAWLGPAAARGPGALSSSS